MDDSLGEDKNPEWEKIFEDSHYWLLYQHIKLFGLLNGLKRLFLWKSNDHA